MFDRATIAPAATAAAKELGLEAIETISGSGHSVSVFGLSHGGGGGDLLVGIGRIADRYAKSATAINIGIEGLIGTELKLASGEAALILQTAGIPAMSDTSPLMRTKALPLLQNAQVRAFGLELDGVSAAVQSSSMVLAQSLLGIFQFVSTGLTMDLADRANAPMIANLKKIVDFLAANNIEVGEATRAVLGARDLSRSKMQLLKNCHEEIFAAATHTVQVLREATFMESFHQRADLTLKETILLVGKGHALNPKFLSAINQSGLTVTNWVRPDELRGARKV